MPERHAITLKEVAYRIPGIEEVTVRRDVAFPGGSGQTLHLDVYYPPHSRAASVLPAVIIIGGYPGEGVQRILGCRFREMGSTVSWARLIAASGLVAIAYDNTHPEADLRALLAWLDTAATELRIDRSRVGLWAASGNVPLAMSLLMTAGGDAEQTVASETRAVSFASLLYGYTLDIGPTRAVADAAATFRFANPCAGATIDSLRRDVPFLLVRAGQDQTAGLNDSLDRFVAAALSRNLPLTLINLPDAPHAFDLEDDGPAARAAIVETLLFLRQHAGLEP